MSGEIDPIVADYLQSATAREASAKAAAAEIERRKQELLIQIQPFRDSFIALGQLLEKLAFQVNAQTQTKTMSLTIDGDRIKFSTKEFSCRISFIVQNGTPILDFDNRVRPIKMLPERTGNVVYWYCLDAPQSQRNTVQELAEFVFWLENQSQQH